jgi:hypothetical protein
VARAGYWMVEEAGAQIALLWKLQAGAMLWDIQMCPHQRETACPPTQSLPTLPRPLTQCHTALVVLLQ